MPIRIYVDEMLRFAKALVDPTRVRIIAALREGELCVCELCDALKVTQSTLSTHLQVIRSAGLVSVRKKGKWMYYDIVPGKRAIVETLFDAFGDSIRINKTLGRDKTNLTARVALRQDGACCVGFVTHGRNQKAVRRELRTIR